MDHLEAAPGLDKHRQGRLIEAVADRSGALLLGAAFPEMTAPSVPFRIKIPSAPGNARIVGRVENLSGAYARLAAMQDAVTLADLGWQVEQAS